MKKLLTVSVLAIMAVSTANADIASTGFVTDRTGTVTGAAFEGLTDADKNLTGAINAIAGRVGSANVDKQIDDAIKNAKVGDLSDGAQYAKTADVVTNAELAGLTGTKDAAAGNVVTGVTTTGGVVTAVSESKITNDFIDDGTISQAKIDGLTGLATQVSTNVGDISDLQAKVGNATVANQISDAISGLNTDMTDIKETVQALPTTYAPINTVEEEEQNAINAASKAITDTIGTGFTSTNTVSSQLSAVKATADGAVQSVVAGSANGTISVDGTDVAVTGLGSAAYTASTDYATAAQGAKADTALQQADITTGSAQGTISVKGEDVTVKGLGSAAYTASTDYATAAQGAKADTAMQLDVLKEDASWTEKGCNASGVVCSLVSRGGDLAWEKVAD